MYVDYLHLAWINNSRFKYDYTLEILHQTDIPVLCKKAAKKCKHMFYFTPYYNLVTPLNSSPQHCVVSVLWDFL